jgi:hypothetical protein
MFSFEETCRTPARTGINKPVFTYGGITHKNRNGPMNILLFAGTLLAICHFVGSASAIATTESTAASAKVYVSIVTFDPGSMYDGV